MFRNFLGNDGFSKYSITNFLDDNDVKIDTKINNLRERQATLTEDIKVKKENLEKATRELKAATDKASGTEYIRQLNIVDQKGKEFAKAMLDYGAFEESYLAKIDQLIDEAIKRRDQIYDEFVSPLQKEYADVKATYELHRRQYWDQKRGKLKNDKITLEQIEKAYLDSMTAERKIHGEKIDRLFTLSNFDPKQQITSRNAPYFKDEKNLNDITKVIGNLLGDPINEKINGIASLKPFFDLSKGLSSYRQAKIDVKDPKYSNCKGIRIFSNSTCDNYDKLWNEIRGFESLWAVCNEIIVDASEIKSTSGPHGIDFEVINFDFKDIFKKVLADQLALNSDNGIEAKRLADANKDIIGKTLNQLTYEQWVAWLQSGLNLDKFEDNTININDPQKRTWGQLLLDDNEKMLKASQAYDWARVYDGKIETHGLDINNPYMIQLEYVHYLKILKYNSYIDGDKKDYKPESLSNNKYYINPDGSKQYFKDLTKECSKWNIFGSKQDIETQFKEMAKCYELNFLQGIDHRERDNLSFDNELSVPISLILTDEKRAEMNAIRQRALDALKALQDADIAAEAELAKLQGDIKIAADALKKVNKEAQYNRDDIIRWENIKRKQINMAQAVREGFQDEFLDEMHSAFKENKFKNGFDIKLNDETGQISLQRTNGGHITGDGYTGNILKAVNEKGLVDNAGMVEESAEDSIPSIIFGVDTDYVLQFNDLPEKNGFTEAQYLDYIKNGFASDEYNCKIKNDDPELCKPIGVGGRSIKNATSMYQKLQADKAMKDMIKKNYTCVKDPKNQTECLKVKRSDGKEYPILILNQQLEDYKKTFIGFDSDKFLAEIGNSFNEIQVKIKELPNQHYVGANDYNDYAGIKITYFDDLKIIETPIRFDMNLPRFINGVGEITSNVKQKVQIAQDNCYFKSGGGFTIKKGVRPYTDLPTLNKFYSYVTSGQGAKKESEFVDSGIGVIKYAPNDSCPGGSFYEGEYTKGVGQSGKGMITCINKDGTINSTYKGEWLNNKRNGLGEYNYYDKDGNNLLYRGEWLNGKMSGMGQIERIITLPTGISYKPVYEGSLLNGQYNGYGKLTNPVDGRFEYGVWKNGVLDVKSLIKDIFPYNTPKTADELSKIKPRTETSSLWIIESIDSTKNTVTLVNNKDEKFIIKDLPIDKINFKLFKDCFEKKTNGTFCSLELDGIESIGDGINIASMDPQILQYVPFSRYQKGASDGVASNLEGFNRYVHDGFRLL